MNKDHFKRLITVLGLGVLAILLVSVMIGRYPQPPWMPFGLLKTDSLARQLVLNLRLPRILVAFLLGVVLSAAGTVLQMIFRNPLVEPGFPGCLPGGCFWSRGQHPLVS